MNKALNKNLKVTEATINNANILEYIFVFHFIRQEQITFILASWKYKYLKLQPL